MHALGSIHRLGCHLPISEFHGGGLVVFGTRGFFGLVGLDVFRVKVCVFLGRGCIFLVGVVGLRLKDTDAVAVAVTTTVAGCSYAYAFDFEVSVTVGHRYNVYCSYNLVYGFRHGYSFRCGYG